MEINTQQLKEGFAGDKKSGKWLLQRYEDKFRSFLVPLVPKFIATYHLTLMTVLWSGGIIYCGYLAQSNIKWLWLSSLFIFCQYITDLLDGAIGRARNTGLIKWGFYMDHFLDYIFFASIVMSYVFIFPGNTIPLIVALAFIQIGFMINMFLSFAATNAFEISFFSFGPTEVRIAYILFNAYLIFFGTGLPILFTKPFIGLMIAALILLVYKTHKRLWAIDMENKKMN